MRWRWGRIALLVFQAIWLNVIVPGHARDRSLAWVGLRCRFVLR